MQLVSFKKDITQNERAGKYVVKARGWRLNIHGLPIFGRRPAKEVAFKAHRPAQLETVDTPESLERQTLPKIMKLACPERSIRKMKYLWVRLTRSTRSDHRSFSTWNGQRFHCCFYELPGPSRNKTLNWSAWEWALNMAHWRSRCSTSEMTVYKGVTTFRRKDSGSPPQAGTTFSPVFRLMEPASTPDNSYAIYGGNNCFKGEDNGPSAQTQPKRKEDPDGDTIGKNTSGIWS